MDAAGLVLYNQDLDQVPLIDVLKNYKNLKLFVADNSTEPNDNARKAHALGAVYLSMNGNQGLSKAYNAIIRQASKEDFERLILFDDDTRVPDDYFDKLALCDLNSIWLPRVVSEKGLLLSPAEYGHGLVRPVKDPSDIKDITGINSGMAIPFQAAKDLGYDSRLFLDFVDHDFIRRAKEAGIAVGVLNTELIQSFSAEGDNSDALKKRFEIFRKDALNFYENRLMAALVIMKRWLSIQLKSLKRN